MRLQVAVHLATLKAKHLRDVREPHAVGVAVDENMGHGVVLSLSPPKSYPFEALATIRGTKFGKSSGVGLSFLVSASMGEPLNASAVSPRIAHCIATDPPMLVPIRSSRGILR